MANQQRTTSIFENDQWTISESPAHSRTTRKSFVSMSSDLYFIYFYIYFINDARLYTKVCIARNGQTNELNINKMFGLGNMWEMRPLFYNLLNRAHGRMLLKKWKCLVLKLDVIIFKIIFWTDCILLSNLFLICCKRFRSKLKTATEY